jgi:outer membrane protein assembly factor BamB
MADRLKQRVESALDHNVVSLRAGFFVMAILLTVSTVVVRPAAVCRAENETAPAKQPNRHPFGLQLNVLARDLSSRDYHEVLETMIPTDLAAEWLRVATPDNYMTFMKKHGGRQAVLSNKQLKTAYDERRYVADRFLNMMRTAYKKRNRRPPFEDVDAVQRLLEKAAEKRTSGPQRSDVPIRVVMPAPGAETQWPRFRGPTGQGTAVEADIPHTWSATENVVWKTKLHGVGSSSPVIWGDQLFITAADESGKNRALFCYSRADGGPMWKKCVPDPPETEKLYWKNTYASSTPVTDGEVVVVFFGNAGLACFNFDGDLIWQKELGPFVTTHGPGTSPVLYKDRVIFIQDQNRGDSVFVALNKRTGDVIWKQPRDNATCWSTPVVARVGEHDELIYNGSHRVVGYDPHTGREIWHLDGPSREAIPTPVIGEGLIFSASGRNGPTLAIRPGGRGDVTQSHLHWERKRGGPHVPSPVYFDQRLYLVNDTGIVTTMDAQTGRILWQKRLRGRFSTSPVEARGLLLLTNERGRTYLVRAGERFEQLAMNDLNENTLATPAVLGGRIYFRTAGHLYCIGTGSVED